MTPADISDYRELARRRLPFFLFEYIDGGSYSETTLARNMGDFQSIILRQNVMRDVSKLNLAIELFGQKWAMPVALSPIGLGGMYARRGEVQTARAAEKIGVPFTLSTMSCCAIEEVRPKVETAPWLQLYMIKDRAFMADLLARATAAGITNLVLTVDLPVHSVRHRDVRSGLTGPQGIDVRIARFVDVLCHPFWAFDVGVMGRPHILGNVAPAMPNGAGLDQFTAWVGRNFDPSITWKDLDWIRGHWNGRLIIKGVLEAEDARAAVSAGAEGVIVSNHGGRQLDGAPSTISALPQIADALAGAVPILLDGGVRSGVDVLRALALGASAVMLGRPWAFALAADGERGVANMLTLLRHEIEVAMALSGQTDVSTIDRSLIAPR